MQTAGKAVLLSINYTWAMRIATGKKTLEVRKNIPSIKPPFKCYIYVSKGKNRLLEVIHNGDRLWGNDIYEDKKPLFIKRGYDGQWTPQWQKVIGEFTCDAIIRNCEMANADIAEQQGLISRERLLEYSNGKELYGWHISDLKIYDKPKELWAFCVPCKNNKSCDSCEHFQRREFIEKCYAPIQYHRPLKKPPQSWCYVQPLKDGEI